MKMTIVIDTDDPIGISDALKIVQIMDNKYGSQPHYRKESFGKIEFIKIIRQFMKESIKHLNDEESNQVKNIDDMTNLRNAKRFADRLWQSKL
tara:strand:+ start:2377 stop:2655 length:279 start_codon:yes stop_codon:yes gene_type:complete